MLQQKSALIGSDGANSLLLQAHPNQLQVLWSQFYPDRFVTLRNLIFCPDVKVT